MTHKHTLYLDMDGVLADFNTAAQEYFQATEEEHLAAAQRGRWPDTQWQKLIQVKNFYRLLPPMPQYQELLAIADKFAQLPDWRVAILTAIPKGNDMPDVFQDKFEWIQQYCPQYRLYFGPYSNDKHNHCLPGDILVDDRTSNCQQWRTAGGIAIQVLPNQYSQALNELNQLLTTLL